MRTNELNQNVDKYDNTPQEHPGEGGLESNHLRSIIQVIVVKTEVYLQDERV